MFSARLASVLVATIIATLVATSVPSSAAEIRWGTSRVGSSGHRAVTALTQFLKDKMPEHTFTVQPTPGALLTIKGHATGEFEGYYGSDVAFYELANDIKRFKGFKDKIQRQPVQTFWAFTLEMGLGVHARDRDKIKSWGDLAGKRVFTGPRPWDTRAQIERALEALGIEFEYVEVSVKTAGSLLESGRYDAFGVYSNAEVTTAPWITEASLQTDWTALNLSDAEAKKLEAKGFKVKQIPTKVFGKKDNYKDNISMVPFYYGLHLGTQISEDDVYKMLTLIEKDAKDLAQADKAFKQVAEDMVGMQVRGVESSIDLVPVHPGLAKFMKEKGVWKSEWDSRIAKGT